jgi:hypothetical protein
VSAALARFVAVCLVATMLMMIRLAPPAAAASSVLFDQVDAPGGSTGITNSQFYGSSLPGGDDMAADDFTVPTGETWVLDQVVAVGEIGGVLGPKGFNIGFYGDSANGPASLIAARTDEAPIVEPGPTGSQFVVHLNAPVTLTAGRYWVSVQAILATDANQTIRWYWVESNQTVLAPAYWQNPGGAIPNNGCPSWKIRSTCLVPHPLYGQQFRLVGEKTTPPPGPVSTVTHLFATPDPSTYGQSVDLRAVVCMLNDTSTPTGTVVFALPDGSTHPVPLNGAVQDPSCSGLPAAAVTLGWSLPTGVDEVVTATFQASDPAVPGSTGTVHVTVNKAATTSSLSADLNPASQGTQVTLSDNVCSAPAAQGLAMPSGVVTLKDGATTLGSAPLQFPNAATGCMRATFVTHTLALGSHPLTAVYGGDTNYTGSTGAMTEVINTMDTVSTLTSGPNPSTFGAKVDFTDRVCPASASAVPTGTVFFKEGVVLLSTGTLVPGGAPQCAAASFSTAVLSPGSHVITAEFTGDPNYKGSTGTVTQNVQCTTTVSGTVGAQNAQNGTCVTGATVKGNLVIPSGASVFIADSNISGVVSSSGSGLVMICNTSVSGSVSISGATGFVLVGGATPSCVGNTIGGSVSLQNNKAGLRLAGNKLASLATIGGNHASGNDPISGGPAGTVISKNTIAGSLSCSGNSPAASDAGVPNATGGSRTGECAASGF